MKVKTFMVTFFLFLSIFFISLMLISKHLLTIQIDSAMEPIGNEHRLISDLMDRELRNLIERGAKKEEAIEYLYHYYANHYIRQKGYIEIFKENKPLYSNFRQPYSQRIYFDCTEKSRTAVFKKLGNGEYIIIIGEFPQTNQEYKIQYIHDITSVIEEWKKIYHILLLIGIGSSLVMVVILIFILHIIFKPLYLVVAASKEIANGNYEKRISLFKTYELASLADSFNYMAEKVQLAITKFSDDARQKQQFIDNFSHEVRTPLTSIYGFAEYMQKSVLSEEEKIVIAGYIMEDSKYILNIADRLLDLATLKNKSIVKKNYPVTLLYYNTNNLLREKINQKQIHLIQENSVEFIYGDEDLLQSLLVNITNNAIDASEQNGIIKWQTYYENKNIVLCVSDNGRGIPQDEVHKINEPFYRVDKSRNRETGNAGLGLAICQQIAKCHNAKIIVQSELGQGTAVKIIFTTLQ